ncbi:hypothetical protein [Colwellia sp. Bg11-28]|uniref:hypothetical protein n=1 Tax=Colwellia sp. Bg11-28 TaxID=2058305 RepID=UPI000C34A215|nr:hypothetical protein [Colwellia sp. Bg11-28]PKH88653.1 hypothetical protein CXF79_04565 [Colwellia sp. Bg11-28]
MKQSKSTGLFCGIAGLAVGVYFGTLPILQNLNSGTLTGQQAGVQLATVAIIVGISAAIMGVIYHRSRNNR